MGDKTVIIARCPIHGLHGQRNRCFDCGGPVEQVAMVPESEHARLQLIIDQAVAFLENRRRDGVDFPYDSRPVRQLREASTIETIPRESDDEAPAEGGCVL